MADPRDADENVNTANLESAAAADAAAAAAAVPVKTPRKPAAASRTAGKTTAAGGGTPATGARARGAASSSASSASLLSTLPAKSKIGVLLKQAEGAVRVNVNNWSQQDTFSCSLEEVLESLSTQTSSSASGGGAAELVALLDESMAPLMAALATCQNCNHSGTQTRALKCFRMLFELAAPAAGTSGSSGAGVQLKRVDAHLDVVLPALLSMVGHNSAAFLRTEGESVLLCAMRHVNAGRVTYTLARELLSDKHEKNMAKMTALAGLAADGMDMLTVGHFPAHKESATSSASGGAQLQDLPKAYYKDIIRCVSKLNLLPHAPFRSAAARMARALVEKGQANFTLTAMLRDLSRTDKSAARVFEALAKELTGKELPSHTTAASAAAQAPGLFSPGSARTRTRSASTVAGGVLATCASPLPASAAKGGKAYANTMPKEIGSPMPVVAAAASVSSNGTTNDAALSQQSHPLPSSSSSDDEHADYQTAGAGLLDNVSESLCFNYSPTAGGRTSATTADASTAAGGSDGVGDAPVERQLFSPSRGDVAGGTSAEALGLSVLDDDDSIVILNPQGSGSGSSSAVGGASAASRDSVLPDALDVSSGMVYNYNRGSMPMDGGAGMRSSMAAGTGPASSTRSRLSSGQKRKADAADLHESELCAADDGALSPASKLLKVGVLTAQLKRAKHDGGAGAGVGASAAATSQTLATAMRLVADVQSAHMARVDAQNKAQHEYWTNMRHNLRSKRQHKQQA